MELLRGCNIPEIREDKDPQCLMTYYNLEESERLKALPKYIAFNKWCDENGIERPGVDFPAAFGK